MTAQGSRLKALGSCLQPRDVLRVVEKRLRDADVTSPQAEAEWLVAGVLGVGRAELYLHDAPIDEETRDRLERFVQRRLAGEPLQYVLGFTDFCGLRLAVSPEVLIPRPETEGLVEAAVAFLRQRGRASPWRILEVGVGSGNIAISLAAAFETCFVVGIELSWAALCVARTNAQAHHAASRIRWVQGDGAAAVAGPFDLVIANPPYVPTAQVHLQGEPRMSLDGGPDGMALHRRLLEEAPRLLAAGGALCMECAEAQAEPLAGEARATSWSSDVQALHDLAGRPRGVWIVR